MGWAMSMWRRKSENNNNKSVSFDLSVDEGLMRE